MSEHIPVLLRIRSTSAAVIAPLCPNESVFARVAQPFAPANAVYLRNWQLTSEYARRCVHRLACILLTAPRRVLPLVACCRETRHSKTALTIEYLEIGDKGSDWVSSHRMFAPAAQQATCIQITQVGRSRGPGTKQTFAPLTHVYMHGRGQRVNNDLMPYSFPYPSSLVRLNTSGKQGSVQTATEDKLGSRHGLSASVQNLPHGASF